MHTFCAIRMPRSLRRATAGLLLALTTALAGPFALATPVAPGQALAPITATDQHDRPWRIEPTTRIVLFAADKAASDLVTEALRERGAEVLRERQAVFLADIHAMPSLVTRLFALPALRELPFAIGLARDAALSAGIPRYKAQVTLVTLRDGVVEAISHLESAAQVRLALGLAGH